MPEQLKPCPWWQIVCGGCEVKIERPTQEMAVRDWNSRAVPAVEDAELDEIRKRCEAATPGPWAWDNRGEKVNDIQVGVALRNDDSPINGFFDDDDAIYVEGVAAEVTNSANADFIAASITDIPRLLELVTRLRAENERLDSRSKECTCACHDDPKHMTVQDWAEANRYHVAKLKDVTAECDEVRSQLAEAKQEIKRLKGGDAK